MGASSYLKPRPHALVKREQKAEAATNGRKEDAKVRQRSGGQCEVRTFLDGPILIARCHRRAVHINHLIFGLGRRNIGRSILAECKQYVCARCHSEFHAHILQPIGTPEQREAARTVIYERAR